MKGEGTCIWDLRWHLRGSYSFVDLWLYARRLCGDVAELCSLINYALAANELRSAELPLQLCASPVKPSPLCTGSWGRAGLWKLLGCGKSGNLFCKSQALRYRPVYNDLPNICKISISQMQSIKSVKLRSWPIN